MKYALYILVALFLISCSHESEPKTFAPATFEIDTLTVESSIIPEDVIRYRNGFVGRIAWDNDSLRLLFMDADFQIDYSTSKELSEGLDKATEAIWTSGDTLFALTGFRKYTIKYRINNNWVVADTGSNHKRNYMHYEKHLPIYEDDDFRVNTCCQGEFGGAVFFYDKKSKKTYSCPSTCLTGIQKFQNSFYVTSSLAHLMYTASILKIDDPRQLFEIKDEQQLSDCSWYDIYPDKPGVVDIRHPKDYDKGYKHLVDTFDLFILGSFELDHQLYWLYSDPSNSYIGQVNDGEIQMLDTIHHKAMYCTDTRDLQHNPYIFPVRLNGTRGVILVEDRTIRIIEFVPPR